MLELRQLYSFQLREQLWILGDEGQSGSSWHFRYALLECLLEEVLRQIYWFVPEQEPVVEKLQNPAFLSGGYSKYPFSSFDRTGFNCAVVFKDCEISELIFTACSRNGFRNCLYVPDKLLEILGKVIELDTALRHRNRREVAGELADFDW